MKRMKGWLLKWFWRRYPVAKKDQERREKLVEQVVANLHDSINHAKESAQKADVVTEQEK